MYSRSRRTFASLLHVLSDLNTFRALNFLQVKYYNFITNSTTYNIQLRYHNRLQFFIFNFSLRSSLEFGLQVEISSTKTLESKTQFVFFCDTAIHLITPSSIHSIFSTLVPWWNENKTIFQVCHFVCWIMQSQKQKGNEKNSDSW